MEVTRFRPYKFDRLSDIFELQFRHFQIYLARFRGFTQQDYARRRLHQRFRWRNLGIAETVLHWTMITAMVLMATQLSPFLNDYAMANEYVMKIDRYHQFIVTGLIGILALEKMCFDSFRSLLNYRQGMIEISIEFADRLRVELSAAQCRTLIALFGRIERFAGFMYKIGCGGLLPLFVQLMWHFGCQWMDGTIGALRTIVYFSVTIGQNLTGARSMSMLFIVMPHIFFVMIIFRLRLSRCVAPLRRVSARRLSLNGGRDDNNNNNNNRKHISAELQRFEIRYMRLHRLINRYNLAIREQIELHESVFKLSGLFASVFYVKRAGRINTAGIMIMALYISCYALFCAIKGTLTHFPAQNLHCFKRIAGIGARRAFAMFAAPHPYHHNLRRRDRFTSQQQWKRQKLPKQQLEPQVIKIAMTTASRNAYYARERLSRSRAQRNIRFTLRIDRLTHFLANNRFGFTYGQNYLVTRQELVKSFGSNIFFFSLFYKKVSFD